MKPTFTVILFFLFLGSAFSQGPEKVPEQLKCFIKGFFQCRKGLKDLCAEFEGDDRRPVPIPKYELGKVS